MKKAEHGRIDAFELWCWRRLFFFFLIFKNFFFIFKLYKIVLVMPNIIMSPPQESPLDCKEIQPVHSEGDQSWDLFGRNNAKAETPVLWPPHAKS